MVHRREALIRMSVTALVPGLLGAAGAEATQEPRERRPKMPVIDHPILFNTPEADRILAGLQVFPPDNPWNQDVSQWPLHPNSKNIIASIGAEKPLRYNPDMGFVLVPPGQKRVDVKIVGYPGESDKGPFPVPDNTAHRRLARRLPAQSVRKGADAGRRPARRAQAGRRPARHRRRSGQPRCSTSSTR